MSKYDEEALWTVLYKIASGFPDSKLSQERLKGYFTFFDSLRYTLPTPELRKFWSATTASGNSELTWDAFSRVRSHKEVLRWLFHVHDEVVRMQGKKVTTSFAERYARITKGTNNTKQKEVNMKHTEPIMNTGTAIALARLKARIKTRARAMDEFLTTRVQGFEKISRARKLKLREQYLDDAAKFYWNMISDHLSATNTNFTKRSVRDRASMIIEAFDEQFMLRHQRAVSTIASMPGTFLESVLG